MAEEKKSDENEMITIEFPIEFRTINGDQEVEVNESSSTLAADIDFKHNFIYFHFFHYFYKHLRGFFYTFLVVCLRSKIHKENSTRIDPKRSN